MKVVNYVQVILYVLSVKTFDPAESSNKFLGGFLTPFPRQDCYFSYEIKIYGDANLLCSTIDITLQIERCLRRAFTSDCRSVKGEWKTDRYSMMNFSTQSTQYLIHIHMHWNGPLGEPICPGCEHNILSTKVNFPTSFHVSALINGNVPHAPTKAKNRFTFMLWSFKAYRLADLVRARPVISTLLSSSAAAFWHDSEQRFEMF